MGQLESLAFDELDPVDTSVLEGDRSVRGIIRAIKNGKIKKIKWEIDTADIFNDRT